MKIHYSVLVLLVLYLYTNMLVCFLLFFACILLHECGHLFFIVIFGGKVHKIELNIFGGRVDCSIPSLSMTKETCLNLGGILVNLILLKIRLPIGEYDAFFKEYNRLLVLFNLLPIFPLDGGRMIESITSRIYRPQKAFVTMTYVSFFFMLVLLIASLLTRSWGLLLITVFLLVKNLERIRKQDAIVLKNMVKLFT